MIWLLTVRNTLHLLPTFAFSPEQPRGLCPPAARAAAGGCRRAVLRGEEGAAVCGDEARLLATGAGRQGSSPGVLARFELKSGSVGMESKQKGERSRGDDG